MGPNLIAEEIALHRRDHELLPKLRPKICHQIPIKVLVIIQQKLHISRGNMHKEQVKHGDIVMGDFSLQFKIKLQMSNFHMLELSVLTEVKVPALRISFQGLYGVQTYWITRQKYLRPTLS